MEFEALLDGYRQGAFSRDVYLARLRQGYHALHASVRSEAVRCVDQLPEPERTRELLQFFHDCQWRQTQIAILRVLGTQPSPRALEFLIHQVHNDADLGMCREAIGKLARDPDLLEMATASAMDDFVEWQIHTNTRQHIVLRSRCSLADYLQRLFDPEQPLLPELVLELNNFPAAAVHQELLRFRHGSRQRLAAILARLDHAAIPQWSTELLASASVPDAELTLILTALQTRHDNAFAPVLLTWRTRCLRSTDDALYAAWLRACALILPHGGQVLAHFFHSACFASQTVARRILAINQLVDHGLACLGDTPRVQSIVIELDALLDMETDPRVLGRILRGFAQLRHPSPKAFTFVQAHLADAEVLPSVLQFLCYCPHQDAWHWLLDWATSAALPRELVTALLLAMAAQDGDIGAVPTAFDALLRMALTDGYGQDACLAALTLLTRYPRPELVDAVLEQLQAPERIRVMAIVTLKSYGEPRATPGLIPLLHETSASIVGRALDTLTAQPDDDARQAILDFLEKHIEDSESVDKIIRCLTPPHDHLPIFLGRLERLMTAHPQHEQGEGLLQLRDRLASAAPPVDRQSNIVAGATPALDAHLARRLRLFSRLDERVKAALRSAELPYAYPDMFHGDVDKSTTILEYCKAIDLFLERHLGRDVLIPRLYDDLPAFQNTIYYAGLNERYPNPAVVLQGLSLRGLVMPERLPLSKMVALAHSVLDGRIQQGQWRILDGLRAWSAALLMFVRAAQDTPSHTSPFPIHLAGVSNQAIIDLALHLDRLQTLRNPVAHRRTLVAFADIATIQHDVADMFSLLDRIFFVREA